MAYLIIPIICFALLAGLAFILFASLAGEKKWNGRIEDLDVILSVLMTAELDEPYLLMKASRRVTWLKMTFSGNGIRLEMPLITARQKHRIEHYRTILQDLNLVGGTLRSGSDKDADHDSLEWDVEGPAARAVPVVKDAFARLFEVDSTKTLEYRAFGNVLDLNVIEQALRGGRPDNDSELPTAATQGRQAGSAKEGRAGCINTLSGLLLLPIPFMIAYLQSGYTAASVVLVAIVLSREVYLRWKGSRRGFGYPTFLRITVLFMTGATIYFDDPFYLQLMPSALLSIIAVTELLSATLDLPRLSVFDWKVKDDPRTERMLMSVAIIATSTGAVVTNEYLRSNLTLDDWMWFFAFFRIELIFGFLVTSVPLLFYTVQRSPRTDNDVEPR